MQDINFKSNTFVFFHIGLDISQPKRLVESIKISNPAATILMCSDRSTPSIQGVSDRFESDGDPKKIMQFRLNSFAGLQVDYPAIYLDTDMVVRSLIDPTALLGEKNITMCRRSFNRDLKFNIKFRGLSFPEYAGKTMDEVYPYLACATVTRNYKPWAEMAITLMTMDDKYSVWYGDQEALKAYAKIEPVGTLSESEYACLPEALANNPNPKIIHFKGARK